jgi:peroxiredoxin family protein
MDMFDIEEKDLIEELDGVLTVGDFYARAEGDGTHVIFI